MKQPCPECGETGACSLSCSIGAENDEYHRGVGRSGAGDDIDPDNEAIHFFEDRAAAIIEHDIVCECGAGDFCCIHDEV